ncbi:MAG: DUF4112 domain-containing protein [Pseudomonadota bacterium]
MSNGLDPTRLTRKLRRLRRLATLMDAAVTIPVVNVRIGWDPVLGLIPGGGDALSAAISAYIVVEAARLGVPTRTLLRMIANIAIDFVVGTVPIAGDWFDVIWRANLMNVDLLERHLATRPPR